MSSFKIIQALVYTLLLVFAGTAWAEGEPRPKPCTAESYNQFDFWLGKWTVSNDAGEIQGNNHIHKIMGNCGMQENWTGGSGFVGTSYNFYDSRSKVWRQTWIDNQGGSLLLTGGLVGTSMQLSGERASREGKTVIDRITWTPLADGRVRQHWQASEDAGKTWSDVFDGYYKRESAEAP